MTRHNTNKILEMIENGMLDAKTVALMCLKWMNEENVTAMAKANGLIEFEEESNPYIINVGTSRFEMEPYESCPTKEAARARVDELINIFKCVEAVYMPEDNDDINEVIYSWYLD